jgi:hypothetical protein
MTGFDWLAAIGLLLVIEGSCRLPRLPWRERFRRMLNSATANCVSSALSRCWVAFFCC